MGKREKEPDTVQASEAEKAASAAHSLSQTAGVTESGAVALVEPPPQEAPRPSGVTRVPSKSLIPCYPYEVPGRPSGHFYTGIDPTTRAGLYSVYNAIQRADNRGRELADKLISMENVVIHPWSMEDKAKGEMREGMRTVIFTTTGETIGFVSDGVATSLMTIAQLIGPPPWKPAVSVVVRYETLPDGRQWCWLKLAGGVEDSR